jgi:hypothetical protein
VPRRNHEVFAQAIAGIVMRGFAELNRGKGITQRNFSTIMKIQQALEREGISFIAEPGGLVWRAAGEGVASRLNFDLAKRSQFFSLVFQQL